MQLSFESYRTRWCALILAWAVSATLLFWQAASVRDYLALAGTLGLRGQNTIATPLKQAYPIFAADGQVWVRHALSLIEGHDLQLRYTTIDNAPAGREVHWNSAWAWTIAAGGWIYRLFSGLPIETSVERATVWVTPAALLLIIILLSAWTTRRAGLIAGLFLVVAMSSNDRVLEGFFPTYVDHHGLLTVAVLGTVLGAILMGGGWWKERSGENSTAMLPASPEMTKSAALFSALCGALGLWVSAASVIPAIAITGICGLAAVIIHGRTAQEQGAMFNPAAWRLWGRAGATLSLFFYLIEYFPRHLGMRLEVNHPFHALAWLGGGELIALVAERWLRTDGPRWTNGRAFLWPLAAVSLVPIAIVIGGPKVLSFLDPFMSRLHNDYIQEFLPLWKTMRGFQPKAIFQILVVDSSPLIVAIATLSYFRRESPIVLWFATLVAGLLTAMAWWQTRWQLNASGGQICLAIVVIACWTFTHRPLVRWIVAGTVMGVMYLPNGVMRVVGTINDIKTRVVSPRDASLLLARDIAAVLRSTQPQGDIVMLASPNASTTIGYYGRFKTLGTLYWENGAGLKAAAAIYSAKNEAEAKKLIREHKVTHIAIVSEENFIEQYNVLLNKAATADEIVKSFGYQLFYRKVVPQWLQMIPYRVPDDLKGLNLGVMLLKVNYDQSLIEAIYHVAEAQIADEKYDDADKTLDMLVKAAPQLPQPWLRKAEIAVLRHDWANATDYFLKGIAVAPQNERPLLYENAAGALYNQRQHEMAIKIYRTGIADQRAPNLLCFLGWVLATSTEDSLRNGKEALALAEEALKADPNSPSYLNAKAGALAELGRFREAVEACDRAVASARAKGEMAVAQAFEQRLAILRTGKPLRN